MSRNSKFKRQLNPSFAAAHGVPDYGVISQKRVDQIISQARKTGKVQAANCNLEDLSPLIEWPALPITESLNNSIEERSWESHIVQTVTLLDVSDNEGLTSLPPQFAEAYNSLRTFRARKCGLSQILLSHQLEKLHTLDLAGNRLTQLDLTTFPRSIVNINVADNQLSALSGSRELPNLNKIDLSNNQLDCLDSLLAPQLLSLMCSENRLGSLNFLATFHHLEDLDAHRNQITDIPDSLAITCPKLQSLNVAGNKISALPTRLPSTLVRIVISNNKITAIDDLDSCRDSLVNLIAEGNDIRQLPCFRKENVSFPKLAAVNLQGNSLQEIPYQLGFMELKKLHIHNNPLLRFKSSQPHLDDTPRLLRLLQNRKPIDDEESRKAQIPYDTGSKQLYLSSHMIGNSTLSLPEQELSDKELYTLLKEVQPSQASMIQRLVVDGNALTTLDCARLFPNLQMLEAAENRVTSLSSVPLEKLLELRLSKNRLQDFDFATSAGPLLQVLNLSRNKIQSLIGLQRMNLPLLRHLNLAGNQLSGFPDDWIPPDSLQVLDLSHNRLSLLPELFPLSLAAHCSTLQTLLLHNNELKTIPYTLGCIRSLTILDVRGNPQQRIRYAVLEQDCSRLLEYLRNRLTLEQLGEATSQIAKMRKRKESSSISPKGHVSSEDDTLHRIEPTSETTSHENSNITAGVQQCETEATAIPPDENRDLTRAQAPTDDLSVLRELEETVSKLSQELAGNISMSQAKRFAVKKQLAMARSKVIREKRRLGQ